MGRTKPSCARNPKYTATITLHMPEELPWREKHLDATLQGEHENAVVLWRGIVRDVLAALGMGHPVVVGGLLMELCNGFPMESRVAIASGIIEGLGLDVKYNPETKQIAVSYVQKYDSIGEKGEVRKASGLVLPGQGM